MSNAQGLRNLWNSGIQPVGKVFGGSGLQPHTGSKTTIQRYLRELEEEEQGLSAGIAVSEVIQQLIERLAARLHEEAEEKWVQQRTRLEAQLFDAATALDVKRQEADAFSLQLQRTEVTLREERTAHQATHDALTEQKSLNQTLAQQVLDLQDRLQDNKSYLESLEEKNRHAREVLEHYRQSVKDQREQDVRQHESQIQPLHLELRDLKQTLVIKQGELTQLYQEMAKLTTTQAATTRALRRSETESQQLNQTATTLRNEVTRLEMDVSKWTEQARLSATGHEATQHLLLQAQARVQELEIAVAQLQAKADTQAEIFATLTLETKTGVPTKG